MRSKVTTISHKFAKGFTLIEMILVLSIIAVLARVVLSGLNFSTSSQLSSSIKALTTQIRGSYDNALFSGHINRIVFDLKKNEYWTEEAPSLENERPPLWENDSELYNTQKNQLDDFRKKLAQKAQAESKRMSPFSSNDNPIFYSNRNLIVVNRKSLEEIKWVEQKNDPIQRKHLIGRAVITKFISGLNNKVYDYNTFSKNKDENNFVYIYFLPDGTTSPTSLQVGLKNENSSIVSTEANLKTLNLNTLTGLVSLYDGEREPNFHSGKM